MASDGKRRSRAYRLKRKEKTAKGVRRIALGRVEHALEQLREQPDGEKAAVHTARKDLKKLRWLLRLVRSELDESTYSAENERYRDAGRLLSGARDAEVKQQTLEALRDRFEDLRVDEYAAALRAERESSGDGRSPCCGCHVRDHHRPLDVVGNGGGNAAHQHVIEPGAPMRPQHHNRGAVLVGKLNDPPPDRVTQSARG